MMAAISVACVSSAKWPRYSRQTCWCGPRGATLMTAVFDESDAMERAIQATIRDAATALR
ncbi:hypothetical protein J2046_005769 [Rhizobium petrolearium]|uniref:hypothetical protein n=1 Tax=Neorhizobium petrolearium TaxID=515361 RepID=UPI001AE3AD6C|nr:hypothetical protein [Neorhizobium petrolearium]MBP1847485.1 hypothetical protein [Neorhizobium petrolearium]